MRADDLSPYRIPQGQLQWFIISVTAAIQPKTKHRLQFMQRYFVLRSTENKLKNVALFF
jgi:hypothetical protein